MNAFGPAEDYVKIRIVKTLAIMGKDAASEDPVFADPVAHGAKSRLA
jgi:hypothetical protein